MSLSPNQVITDWSDPKTVYVEHFVPSVKYGAISHRWDFDALTEEVTVVNRATNKTYPAKVHERLHEHVQSTLLGSFRGIFQDQICIRQDIKEDHEDWKAKMEQIADMGNVYMGCTTIVCSENGLPGMPLSEHAYWKRAWTQQEFSYGNVIFSGIDVLIERQPREVIKLIVETFKSIVEVRDMLEIPLHGRTWSPSSEAWRLSNVINRPGYAGIEGGKFAGQCQNVWNKCWTSDDTAVAKLLVEFRAKCCHHGEDGLGMYTLHYMNKTQCYCPKDQLYGCFGVVHQAMEGAGLDYEDPNGAWECVLKNVFGGSFMKFFDDCDCLGVHSQCNGVWITNDWDQLRHPNWTPHFPPGYVEVLKPTPLCSVMENWENEGGDKETSIFAVKWKSRVAFGLCRNPETAYSMEDLIVGLCIDDTPKFQALVVETSGHPFSERLDQYCDKKPENIRKDLLEGYFKNLVKAYLDTF